MFGGSYSLLGTVVVPVVEEEDMLLDVSTLYDLQVGIYE